jgi:hypothetical protein
MKYLQLYSTQAYDYGVDPIMKAMVLLKNSLANIEVQFYVHSLLCFELACRYCRFIAHIFIPWDKASFLGLKNILYNLISLYFIIHADEDRNPETFLVFRH